MARCPLLTVSLLLVALHVSSARSQSSSGSLNRTSIRIPGRRALREASDKDSGQTACARAGCSACGNWQPELTEGHAQALKTSTREQEHYDAFLKSCGCSASAACKDFIPLFLAYARYHKAVTRGDAGVMNTARILVIQSAWRMLGMGHMAGEICYELSTICNFFP